MTGPTGVQLFNSKNHTSHCLYRNQPICHSNHRKEPVQKLLCA
jgi:hypothetical protein